MSRSFVSSKSVCLAECDFLLTDFFSRQNPSGLVQIEIERMEIHKRRIKIEVKKRVTAELERGKLEF